MVYIVRVFIIVLLLVATSGCSGVKDFFNTLVNSGEDVPPVSGTITGTATKGALSNADIRVYTLDAAGNKNTLVSQTITNANGEWGLDVPSTYDLLLVESSGGSYIDESDNEPDINKKRKITLGATDSLYGLIFNGESTAAVNILTNSFYEELKRETVKSSDLVYTANMIRQKTINTFGFDIFTTVPTDPIDPSITATNPQKYYAMLLGGIANTVNTSAIYAHKSYMDYESIMAIMTDFIDCQIDGKDNGVPIPLGPVTLPAELDVKRETERFRNNNFKAYGSLGELVVNQAQWCLTGPQPVVSTEYVFQDGTIILYANDYVTDPDAGETFTLGTTFTSVSGATVIDNGDGSFTYNAFPAFVGVDQLTFEVFDSFGFKATVFLNLDVSPDGDGDGLTDSEETNLYSTSIALSDTDGDGFTDWHEVHAGSDPNLIASTPSGTVVGGSYNVSATWNIAGSPYWVQTSVNVNNGATLTIENGVVVKFDPGTSLFVNSGGGLQVTGGGPMPSNWNVIFTSIEDDSYQGDTSGNGPVTPTAGSWNGLVFGLGSSSSVSYARIYYPNTGMSFYDSAPSISYVDVYNTLAGDEAIVVHGGTAAPYLSFVNAFSGNYGLSLTGGAGGSYNDMYIANSIKAAIRFGQGSSPANMTQVTLSNVPTPYEVVGQDLPVTAAYINGGAVNEKYVVLSGPFDSGIVTLGSDPLANAGSVWLVNNVLDINSGGTLQFNTDGTYVKFDGPPSGINVNNGGTFNVSPTTGAVTFTSFNDDLYADSDSDGATTPPNYGDWQGIKFSAGSSGIVDRLTMYWAGTGVHVIDASPVFTNLKVFYSLVNNVLLQSSIAGTNSTSFANTTLNTSTGSGVFLASAGGTLNPTFNSTSVQFTSIGYPSIEVTGGSPTFDGVSTQGGTYGFSISGAASAIIKNGIVYDADESGIYANTTGLVEIVGNNIVSNGYGGTFNGGIYVLNAAAGTIIKHNLVRQNKASSGGGIRIDATNSVSVLNNRIIENEATSAGGGVFVSAASTVEIRSNTIVGNMVPGLGDAGGGINSTTTSGITMTDNILWGNLSNAITDDLNTGFVNSNTIEYNMLQESTTGVSLVTNTEGTDPLFAEGWYLGLSSPAFDTGSTASFPTYITELLSPITDAAGAVDSGQLDKGVHYSNAPIYVDAANSTVTPATQTTSISMQVQITITPRDSFSTWLGAGQNVTISLAGMGSVSKVTDLGNGYYTAIFTASATPAESGTLTINVNGTNLITQPVINW